MDGLLIGRFQPFHLGHLAAVRFALSRADRLWLGIGSSNRPPGGENPFTADERRHMIESSLGQAESRRVRIFYIPDLEDHDRWVGSLGGIVPPYGAVFTNDETTGRICAGQGARVVAVPFTRRDELSGTGIRARMAQGAEWRHLVPAGTAGILDRMGKGRLRGSL